MTKARRMTPADYAELGILSPHCPACGGLPPCRCTLNEMPRWDGTLDDLVGLRFTATVARPGWGKSDQLRQDVERCDECGDEKGECCCDE